MNALKLTLIASLFAFATAHAAGDEIAVETIVVTAKRPAFIEPVGPVLVVTVRPEDSVVLVPPKTEPVIEAPMLELPKLEIAPPRIMLALADPAPAQG